MQQAKLHHAEQSNLQSDTCDGASDSIVNTAPSDNIHDNYHIYTDGGYFEKLDVGGWGLVIFKNDQEILRDSGWQKQTSSLEMELYAAKKALEHINDISDIKQNFNYDNDTKLQETRQSNKRLDSSSKLTSSFSITLFTDSRILIEGLTEKYAMWCANQWRVKSGKTVVYKELWQSLSKLTQQQKVTLRWIKGHNGNLGNTVADSLARQAVINKAQFS